MTNYQRKVAASNTAVGIEFESFAYKYFRGEHPNLTRPFYLAIGHLHQKQHKFDLGCKETKVIVECKSHIWTEGGNVPSAKLTTWDQAMLYFYLAPRSYRKLFVVKKDTNPKTGESLADSYLRTHNHVIPDEVEFWEVNEEKGEIKKMEVDFTAHITGDRERGPFEEKTNNAMKSDA